MKLYENIRKYRKLQNLTQDELAHMAGYTDRSSIAKIEKGLIDLSQSKIQQFADIFGVTPGNLMGWDEVKKNNDALSDIIVRLRVDDVFRSAVESLYDMDSEKLKNLLGFLK